MSDQILDLFTTASDIVGAVGSGNASTPLQELATNQGKGGFVHQIRDQLFYIEIWMYNQIAGQKPFQVPFYLVNSLAIEETLFEFNVKGWIVFNTNFEIIERGAKDKESTIPPGFIFRTDGRNRISLKIYPIPNTEGNYNITTGNSDVLPKDKWEMCFDCVIYDVEDLPTNSAQVKLRKFYFWDERYQHFLEKNIEWSTGVQGLKEWTNSDGRDSYLLPDVQRAIPASYAIRSIIDTAALRNPTNDTINGNTIRIGWVEGGGSIDKPNVNLNLFNPIWDGGCAELTDNRIRKDLVFYTSPANSNVLDDLNYVLENAISENGYPVFLRYGRHSNDKQWTLYGLEDLFANAKNEQVERLVIADGLTPSKPYIPRAPQEFGGDIINFMSGIASTITEYKFAPMVSIDDNRIVNTPLHHFDFSRGEYRIYSKENTAKMVSDELTQVAKQGLYAIQQSGGHVLLNVNQTKQKGLMLYNAFSPKPFIAPEAPRISMLKDAIFLNEALSFVTHGLTIRSPGRFVFIDHSDSNDYNAFDDRFLGQWMITRVVHLFSQDNYLTEVVANKVDTFSKIWDVNDNNL